MATCRGATGRGEQQPFHSPGHGAEAWNMGSPVEAVEQIGLWLVCGARDAAPRLPLSWTCPTTRPRSTVDR